VTQGESRLGALIRRQRELRDMSMRQVATMAGISNPYLSQIERGLREPSERVLDAIAESLEISADTLRATAGVGHGAHENDVVAAIRADRALTPRQREALLEIYRAFTAAATPPAPRASAADATPGAAPR
jgi:transcriptional regulator with XRE-family HTH domain